MLNNISLNNLNSSQTNISTNDSISTGLINQGAMSNISSSNKFDILLDNVTLDLHNIVSPLINPPPLKEYLAPMAQSQIKQSPIPVQSHAKWTRQPNPHANILTTNTPILHHTLTNPS